MLHSLGGDVSNLHGAQGPQHNPHPAGTELQGPHTPNPLSSYVSVTSLGWTKTEVAHSLVRVLIACGVVTTVIAQGLSLVTHALWISMSVCLSFTWPHLYSSLCARICVLTSWSAAVVEAEARVLPFFGNFCGDVCDQGLQESASLSLTVLGVCGFMSQVELSNPRPCFSQSHGHGGGIAVRIFAIPLCREHSNTVQGRRPLRPWGLRGLTSVHPAETQT